MTFEEAVSLVDRIKEQVIGVPVKGRLIESLFIGLQTGMKCMFL